MTKEISEDIKSVLLEGKLPLFERAVLFATAAHSGVTRKGSNIPYLVHPIEAAAIVAEMTEDEELIAAAVLHDVLEDTEVTSQELEMFFGERIVHYVLGESEDKRRHLPPEETWKLRKQETIDFLKEKADKNAKILALGDKLSNLRSISRDLESIGESLWERFHQKDRTMHAWMYYELVDALSELQEYSAWKEYKRLVEQVFHKTNVD